MSSEFSRGPGLHHFAVRAVDFEASLRFYQDGLGFSSPRLWSFPPYVEQAAFLDSGNGTWLELFAGGEPASREEPTEGLIHVALLYDDVDAAFARAVAAGATVVMEPARFDLDEWSVRLALVQGPSGERLELYATTLR